MICVQRGARSNESRCRTRSMRCRRITSLRRQRRALIFRGSMVCVTGCRAKDANTLSAMYRKTRDEGFGAEVKRRILLGTYALSAGYYDAYYRKAQQVRTLLARDFLAAFAKVDAIVCPVTPTPAFKLGEKTDDPLQMYLEDIYSVAASLAGICGMSVPCGRDRGWAADWSAGAGAALR